MSDRLHLLEAIFNVNISTESAPVSVDLKRNTNTIIDPTQYLQNLENRKELIVLDNNYIEVIEFVLNAKPLLAFDYFLTFL